MLAKIIHPEFNVFQFVTEENKVYRIYEMKNGIVIGIWYKKTKVITPIENNREYKEMYNKYRHTTFIN